MFRETKLFKYIACSIFILAAAYSSWAVDGTILINQNKANNGNVTAGDLPGFPVTISVPGSFRLSGNLTVPDANTTAIEIQASNVTLDLNGFKIQGSTVCSNGVCTPTGSGKGVHIVDIGYSNTTVINGSVVGMGNRGLDLGAFCRIDRVHARHNGGTGMYCHSDGLVTGSTSIENGEDGIYTGYRSAVSGNVANFNLDDGIDCYGCTVSNNYASYNSNRGISAFNASLVIANTAENNGSLGVYSGSGGYVNNTINYNNGGNNFPQAGGVKMGSNICGGDTTCP